MTAERHWAGRATWIAQDDDVGARADVVLGRRITGLSRRVAKGLALGGALRVDGRRAPPSHCVALGEQLQLMGEEPRTESIGLRVLAVTADFVYVDKPAGVHTHRLRPGDEVTLADAVVTLHPECATASDDPREGGAIHRLDRGTTGVVAFARGADAWRRGRAAMAAKACRKIYAALARTQAAPTWPPRVGLDVTSPDGEKWWHVDGLPRPRSESLLRLELPLGRGPDRRTVAVRDDGRPTHCTFVPLAQSVAPGPDGRTRTLFAVALGRGYRHQIRVHLAWLGLPIEGDDRYDPSAVSHGSSPPRLALHCASLDLSACCPGEARVEAALPDAFAQRIGALMLQAWAPGARPC